MKISWGTGIAIFYCTFMVATISMVVQASKHDPGLVAKNYYEDDLGYQKIYDKRQNSQNLAHTVVVALDDQHENLDIRFPKENEGTPTGEVRFFRPSDKSLDFKVPLQVSVEGKMSIPTNQLPKGLWRVSVDWQQNGVDMLKETVLFI